MKTNGNDKALEAYKIFPYVAWVLVIGFTFFVYNIATELKDVADNLERQTDQLQIKINAQPSEVIDYEA